ncbi:hypothetical protein [Antrihabitans sp. YC2-6]|uniref:hypothetical protein n=1 Tax=Antrihabitans sp. YC2-6 TaxID=2799498 RepID=UPI0018F402B6|nr:hypothetical protein [Antrihabitans sp. YC2-6]MBJ8347014.1 hypothetical protein [Antrihabitans sp. YC2-6]
MSGSVVSPIDRHPPATVTSLRDGIADVLAENYRMLKVFRDIRWPCKYRRSYGVVHLEIELEEASPNA